MNTGLKAVLAALDSAPGPVQFILRDDDAGWDDARLFALLDCTERAGVPIDLAVIPQATGTALGALLRARVDAAPFHIGLHQHGWSHQNHETCARKCEFGAARERAAQSLDLTLGRDRLHALFGARLDPIFTPPWNRCSPATPALLAELGYAALSRDRGAPAQHALPELAVDVDWCKLRAGAGDGAPIAFELARRIGVGASVGARVGLMLHHAQMDRADLDLLGAWLPQWARHPHARWIPMRNLLASTPAAADPGPTHEGAAFS